MVAFMVVSPGGELDWTRHQKSISGSRRFFLDQAVGCASMLTTTENVMNVAKRSELKELMRSGTNLGQIYHFFMETFGEDPSFLAQGEGVRNSNIERIVQLIGAQLFQGQVELTDLFLLRVAELGFIHGGLTVNGLSGTVIYFEEMDKGLLAIVDFPPKSCQYFCFTLAQLPPRTGESIP
jgi:hypothetical protein